ncbi:MAG TPA: insulinase family protein [Bacteroidetes bacterium]|nr:insulinase family protein [Bacteroidota bacterium]
MKKIFRLSVILIFLLSGCGAKQDQLSIPYQMYKLDNGLTVVLNQDKSDPITAIAIYYHVGSSREVPGKTGFAHLFEHMMFQRSENVGEDEFFRNIQGAGGTLNGSTSQDRTNYYEVVPKNALELALWMESDRMGYLQNTVTKAAFVNQQNVVQNEKRQSYDNVAYGFSNEVILKNLYPAGHPYSWTVIGEMEDLTNATIDDVKQFHSKFYSPNNAILAISGDFELEELKAMIEKYFGEIPAGQEVEKREPMPVTLESTKRLYHEDNFARAPRLTMVFPTVERYNPDSYALYFLGRILGGTKKSPLYTVLVKEQKLTSAVSSSSNAQELAGSFNITITANPGVNLTKVEDAIFEAFGRFEKEGFEEEDLIRIKAQRETSFYSSFASTQGKAFSLAEYTMYTGDPSYYKKDLEAYQKVTSNDIWRVYEKYIKNKNFLETSFVPKGEVGLIAEGAIDAGVVEEDIANAAEVKIETIEEEPILKTPTSFDRSIAPQLGPDPLVTIPPIWKASMDNGMKIWGVEQHELPMIQYSISFDGGRIAEPIEKAGLSSLVASLMREGTKNKTPEELEDAIGLLGASISISSGTENITINVSSLSKHFEATVDIVKEILLEPRWDEEQFALAKERTINSIKRSKSDASSLASEAMNKLLFNKDNILSFMPSGTVETVEGIVIDDLKDYYDSFITPSTANFIIAGNIDQKRVEKALSGLVSSWPGKKVVIPASEGAVEPEKSALYFVDVPGAKQSVISVAAPGPAITSSDYYPLFVANYKLGGSFNGIVNLILREEKGYTYGARTSVSGGKNFGTFQGSSSVRTTATLESVQIYKEEMEKYRESMPQEYIDFTKDALIKGDALSYESLGSLINMTRNIAIYGLSDNYIKERENWLRNLTPEIQLEIVRKYIDPAKMYFIVVGDAETQLKEMEKLGLGKPILMDL